MKTVLLTTQVRKCVPIAKCKNTLWCSHLKGLCSVNKKDEAVYVRDSMMNCKIITHHDLTFCNTVYMNLGKW